MSSEDKSGAQSMESQCLPWKAGAQKAPFLESRSDALKFTAASHSSLKSCCPILEKQSEVHASAGRGGPAEVLPGQEWQS